MMADHVDNYTGIDSSQSAVSDARNKNRNVVHGSVEDCLPFEDNSFDAVLLKDILEHLSSPALAVSECKRVLRPSGRLAAFAPDAQRWVWDDYTHIRPFTRAGFRKLFEDQGLLIDKAAYEPLMPGVWYLTILLKRSSRPSFLWKLAWLPKMKRNVMVVATKPQ